MNTSHYPSLELCKKLTDLGFPMNKLIYHITNWWSLICNMDVYKLTNQKPPIGGVEYVCPSISELLDEMPLSIQWCVLTIVRNIHDKDIYYQVSYEHINDGIIFLNILKETLPDALALIWIWLKENNYLTNI